MSNFLSQRPRYTGYDFYIGYPADYRQFLQDREFSRVQSVAIDEQTDRLLYGTRASTVEHGFQIERVRGAVSELESVAKIGNETLSDIRDELRNVTFANDLGFRTLDTTFRWGISEVIVAVGGLATSLDELKRIAQTPAQTWAYEQYEIARIELGRGWFKEALNSVGLAIDGHGNMPGYRTEYRFHYLLGIIRLGSSSNTDPTVVDPLKAEDAFVLAARYSSGLAFEFMSWFSAGRAALVQRALDRAADYTRKCISLNSDYGYSHYQMAKVLFGQGNLDDGVKYLRTAVLLESAFADMAVRDGDFLISSHEIQECFVRLKHDASMVARGAIEIYEAAMDGVEDCRLGAWSIVGLGKTEIECLRRELKVCRELLESDSLKDKLFLPSKIMQWFISFRKTMNLIKEKNRARYEYEIAPEPKNLLEKASELTKEANAKKKKIEKLDLFETSDWYMTVTGITLIIPAIGVFACLASGISFSIFVEDFFNRGRIFAYPSLVIWLSYPVKILSRVIERGMLRSAEVAQRKELASVVSEISEKRASSIDKYKKTMSFIDSFLTDAFLKNPDCTIYRDV